MKGEDELLAGRQKFDQGLKEMFDVIGRVPPVMTVTVDSGHTLWKLAETYLNDGQRWREIYIMNFDVIIRNQNYHGGLQGPDLIYPGTELQLLAL